MEYSDFAHLRVHSAYSLSEGASKINDLVARAKSMKLPAMALTDRNNMFGAMTFSKVASSNGIQPITGLHLNLSLDKKDAGNVVLLAKNEDGYRNICTIVGMVTKSPDSLIEISELRNHADGVILLTGGGADGLLPLLVASNPEKAKGVYRDMLAMFGDRLYVEICRNESPTPEAKGVEQGLLGLAMGGAGKVACDDGVERSEAPIVATSDIWYDDESRHDAYLLLHAVSKRETVSVDDGVIVTENRTNFSIRSAAAMAELFSDLPEAYENAANIAKRCSFLVKGRKPILPAFTSPDGRSESESLRHLAEVGLEARLEASGITGDEAELRRERLRYELGVIDKMGFPGYFLIVADFIQWAKRNDIPVGPGRGSGAGSIVAWALTITDLDPLEFNLLFERFLNPERVSMPDFDIDFCQDRRDEVREYVKAKYGPDRVSLISTFGFIKSRTALTDMQRVVIDENNGHVSFSDVKELTKVIPKKEDSADPMGLMEAYEKEPSFRDKVNSSELLKGVFNQACKVEGLIRTSGSHAAGLVIGDRPLSELIPLSFDSDANMLVAGFDMKGVEDAGLVKFDFLGLTTLSVLKMACENIKATRGIDLNLAAIPKKDDSVYQMLSAGRCAGVFQFEGGGMRKVMQQIRPTRFEDLIAIVALFRPGPMAYIDHYAARKDGRETFEYPGDPKKTELFLSETYGIMVYQEQVMQVAQACAGYSLGAADLLRRAMGKKIQSEMDLQRKVFIHGDPKASPPIPGAVALGMSVEAANSLFDDIVPFAGYGFNKSHAAAYAWIGYQTAWMKAHYPAEYLSALMSYYVDNPEKLSIIKDELDIMGVPLLPPDINRSLGRFCPEESKGAKMGGYGIRFGLAAIKQVGQAGNFIAAERVENGPFRNFHDFHSRTSGGMNKAQYERLAEVGAFSCFNRVRRQASEILNFYMGRKKTIVKGQSDLFADETGAVSPPDKLLELPEWDNVIAREFNAIGFYCNNHPIDPLVPRLTIGGVRRKKSIVQWMKDHRTQTLGSRKLCAMVEAVNVRQSRNNTTYLDVRVSEKSDVYYVSCYQSRYGGGMSFDEMRTTLEGSRVSRYPVVFVCSMVMNNDGTDAWVNASEVWHVEKFLSEIHGRVITVSIDPETITLNREERGIATNTPKDEESFLDNSIAMITKARKVATHRVIEDIKRHIQACDVAKDFSQGSVITISTPFGVENILQPYVITQKTIHLLRQADGVVSVADFSENENRREETSPAEAATSPAM